MSADERRRAALTYANTKLEQAAAVVLASRQFLSPQHAVAALRFCGMWSRLQHICVLLACQGLATRDDIMQLLSRGECVDMYCMAVVLGEFGSLLGPMAWTQSCLPTSLGGLGLSSPTAYEPLLRAKAVSVRTSSMRPRGAWPSRGFRRCPDFICLR